VDEKYLSFINPVITKVSEEKNSFPEGCLSSLPLVAETVRPAEIDMTYLDTEGDEHSEHFGGKMARVLQHEIDHLNGILFIDRADMKKSRFVDDWDEYKKTAQLTDI
jgi:peptide deformylase